MNAPMPERDLLVALVYRTRLDIAVPQALDLVAHDPLIAVHSFRGDLLRGLMEVPDQFWRRHMPLYEQYRNAVRAGAKARIGLPDEVRLEFWSALEINHSHDSPKTQSLRPELDDVNDVSFDSFPASDPPSWTSMHAGAPQSTAIAS
jgi:hypothetical protein